MAEEKQRMYLLQLPEKDFKMIDRALSNFRSMAEDNHAKIAFMFGPDSPHTEAAWQMFVDTDNLLCDFVNGKYEPVDIIINNSQE